MCFYVMSKEVHNSLIKCCLKGIHLNMEYPEDILQVFEER